MRIIYKHIRGSSIMKSIISAFLLLIPCITHAQRYERYSAVPDLNRGMEYFKGDVFQGIKLFEGDTLKAELWPRFDRIYQFKKYIIGQIYYHGRDYSADRYLSNTITLCLSEDLRLRFIFPLHTESFSYNAEQHVFYYCTFCSFEQEWYNRGIIDEDGEIIAKAEPYTFNYLYDDIILTIYEQNLTDGADTYSIKASIRSMSDSKKESRFDFQFPARVWPIFPRYVMEGGDDESKSAQLLIQSFFPLMEKKLSGEDIRCDLKYYNDQIDDIDILTSSCLKHNLKQLQRISKKYR